MFQLSGFDHRTGHHCGTSALRNLSEFHGWNFDEATCFGLGGGIASVTLDRADRDWHEFLGRPLWLEEQFFESLDIDYVRREEDSFEDAWESITGRLDMEEPVLLFLDPTELDHVPATGHISPHVALAIGYGDDALLLSDATEPDAFELPIADLNRSWSGGQIRDLNYSHIVVTDVQTGVDLETAANRAFRETTTYMLDTRSYERRLGAAGDHGPDAIRTFANRVGSWADRDDPIPPARHARYSIEEHGRGAAFRRLYADALDVLAPEAGVGGPVADRMRTIAEEWEAAAAAFGTAVSADDDAERRTALSEAEGALNGIAEQEHRFFKHARDEF
ncbi:BtrH N-terminal domain-containing protein [Haloplanus halobius]|uniref:BtrH N-terminal domain-containing protein n=1 Tax=Haloplanus halobius TaxID=2934938 RepID=UPI00200D0410|nr:BtrH N-terminal domain-containing protein [Haloplanus sp. XH21]